MIDRVSRSQSGDIASRSRPYVTLLAFLIFVSAVLLFIGRADPTAFEKSRLWVLDGIAPVLETVSKPVMSAIDYIGRADDIVALYEENDRLREENRQLQDWRQASIQLEQKLERYQALLNVQIDPRMDFVTGRVIAENGGPFLRTFVVNLGRNQNIKKGHAVVDSSGLIGRVVATGKDASRILLLTDLNSRVPVFVEPEHIRAILAGDNRNSPYLEYLPKNYQPQVGSRVVTSGDGGLLPPGLPIGMVTQNQPDDQFRVALFSNLSKTDFVRIVQYEFPKVDPFEEEGEATDEPEEGADPKANVSGSTDSNTTQSAVAPQRVTRQ